MLLLKGLKVRLDRSLTSQYTWYAESCFYINLICWILQRFQPNVYCTLQTITYWTDSVTLHLYLYLVTVKTWSETESCQMSGVLFTWSLSDLVTAVRLIKWLCFCLWVQTPSEQGTSYARETTDQQCRQEKETHWGEWWADQNKYYSFIFLSLFCPVIILSYLSVHSILYFKLLYYYIFGVCSMDSLFYYLACSIF